MISYARHTIVLTFCFMIAMPLFGCQKAKPKIGKVIITKQKFSMRQESKYNWTIDAKGEVKNVGDVDVKNVVVSGYCPSCGKTIMPGAWSEFQVAKAPDQEDVIKNLPVGAEKEFSFKEVAFMVTQVGKTPAKMPNKMECKILSFQTVQK